MKISTRTNRTRDIVLQLSDEDLQRVFEDIEQLDQDMMIGDCFLREIAAMVLSDDPVPIITMEVVAKEVYRRMAIESMEK